MVMSHMRELLNEIKWTKDINQIEIWYLHRGAPNDTKILPGKDIIALGKSFFETKTGLIPYHRIRRIYYRQKPRRSFSSSSI